MEKTIDTVVVTGAEGFIGKNLRVALGRRGDLTVFPFDVADSWESLLHVLPRARAVFHLAGVNRPERDEDFAAGNGELTERLVEALGSAGSAPLVVLSSSTQAALGNPYGASKRRAENAVWEFGSATGAPVRVFRLPGVFGKWGRPHYNSVVSTFCHCFARDLPVEISDPAREVDLVYVGDVVAAFCALLDGRDPAMSEEGICRVEPTFRVALGALAEALQSFRESRLTLRLPDMADPFTRRLYATFLSYLPGKDFSYELQKRSDPRGELAELFKSPHFGQLFVSRTRPGITRGNHAHDLKVEKFVVLEGKAVVRFRSVLGTDVIEYPVVGTEFRVVDIPPGYTHSIENVGSSDMVVLFWAGEPFDQENPDTYSCQV